MKNLFKVTLFAASLFAVAQAHAQTQRDSTVGHKISKTTKKVTHSTTVEAKRVGNATADEATKVGNKTSELAAKGAAAVVDKKYEDMVAPGGQTVYINEHSQYYYVNSKGHRVFVKKSQLVAKP